jgi:hypothetical protein
MALEINQSTPFDLFFYGMVTRRVAEHARAKNKGSSA